MADPIIAPSLLAADSSGFGRAVRLVEEAGAGYLHIDVMDGHFVPNLSFGPDIVAGIRRASKLYFDVHLMIEYPERLIPAFIKSGADCITVHAEAPGSFEEAVALCRASGIGFGVSIKPRTPVDEYLSYYAFCDILLIMSVEPGYGGQSFIPASADRIAQAKKIREDMGLNYLISVDGGVNFETAPLCLSAGADILVAGTTIFGVEDPARAICGLMRRTL